MESYIFFPLLETGSLVWADVKKQTGTARQNVTTASARPASLKQMACRGRARLFQAVPGWPWPQHLSLTCHCHERTEKHIQFNRIRPLFCPIKLASSVVRHLERLFNLIAQRLQVQCLVGVVHELEKCWNIPPLSSLL